jgi:hypothetical protein
MLIVTLNTFWTQRCTIVRRRYVNNLTLRTRTLHRSKYYWVKIRFLMRKGSFASTSVLVVFVGETLTLVQVSVRKISTFTTFSEICDFFTGRRQPFAQPPDWWTRSPNLWPPETDWPRFTVRHWVSLKPGFYFTYSK